MSKLTRVRVEFFSNTIASTRPTSGASASALPLGQPARAALRSSASARIAARPSAPADDRSRKWRGSVIARHYIGPRAFAQALDRLGDMLFLDDQRRQQAHRVVARGDRQQAVMIAQMGDEIAARMLELEALHQPFAAHALEQIVMIGNELLQTRAQPLAHRLDMLEEAGLEDDVEHRLARGHRQRI